MDGDSRTVPAKPVPLPRKSNRNFDTHETKSQGSKGSSDSSSDINSNIDSLLKPKANLGKLSASTFDSGNSRPVPLPRKSAKNNGTSSTCGNLPDLTNFSSAPQSITGSVISEDFEDDNDDDIDYDSIPSRPNLISNDSESKRGTINLFKREMGDPFEDFERSIKETEPLTTITFRSPLDDLDEATRSRMSISSLSSSTTTTSKSSSDNCDLYMEAPPARPLPPELTIAGRWRSSGGSSSNHGPYSFNTVPSKPKRCPNIVLPRLSSLEEDGGSGSPKKSPAKLRSYQPNPVLSSNAIDNEMCYEPISSYCSLGNSAGGSKFNTISSSTKTIHNNTNNFSSISTSEECKLPINRNFSKSKRVTVPNIEKLPFTPQSNFSNHTSLNVTEDEPERKFDPTAYDISDVHKFVKESDSASSKLSHSVLDNVKRRSSAKTLSGSQEFQSDGDSDRPTSSVIIRRHSSSRSTSTSTSSVGSNRTTGGSKRDSHKKKVHEYDAVAIEDGTVVFLSQSNSDSSSTTINNNSLSSLTSRNSVVQEFDPLLRCKSHNIATGFPVSTTPLDLNDTQQHRYEYIDTDGEDAPDTISCDGSLTHNEGSPVRIMEPLYLDNPAYTPCTPPPRNSRKIKSISEEYEYEPVAPPNEGISPKLSPRPRMGTRVLRKTEEFPDPNQALPPLPPVPGMSVSIVEEPEEKSQDSLTDPATLGIVAPAPMAPPTTSGNQTFFRKFSSKMRLKAIKEEKDADKKLENNLEEGYPSVTTPCNKCLEPHPESTKCKFAPVYRQNIVYSSHLHKTSGLSKKEFSKKWAVLAKGNLTFYNDKSDVISEIPLDKFCVVSKKNEHRVSQSQTDLKCFELCIAGGKLATYVFASGTEGERCSWMQKLIEVFTSAFPVSVLSNFDKAGWCFIKETVTSDWRPCWLILKDRSLYYCYWKGDESFEMDLRKARSVVLSQKESEYKCPYLDNADVLTVDFICKLLYIQTESPKVTSSWEKLIKLTSSTNGSEFHQMQLTLDNVPVIVDKCIDFLYAHGTLSEGIYRQSGSNTRITQLLQEFRQDAWSVQISHKEYSAHDVAGTLKRFFRTLPEPLVTIRLYDDWIKTSSIKNVEIRKEGYLKLLDDLSQRSEINYNIMKKLMCHLYAVHELHEKNLMPLINLAPIWGPTLLNVDSSKLAQSYEIACAECDVVKDLIENYYKLFRVDSQEIAREKKMQDALENFHLGSIKRKCSGDMKIWIYVWEKDETSPINITLTPNSTVHAIVDQICSMNKIKNIDHLTLHEVICNESLERPLHPSEKVIETVLRWSIWDSEERKSNYLILKKNTLYPSLVHYAKEPKSISGELKYADSKSKSFRKFTFQFNQAILKYFKDAKLTSEVGSYKIEDIVWYMGSEPKRNAPTRWTFTIVKRNYPFKRSKEEPFFGNVIVCASEDELHKWIGSMVIGEHPEGLSPIIV